MTAYQSTHSMPSDCHLVLKDVCFAAGLWHALGESDAPHARRAAQHSQQPRDFATTTTGEMERRGDMTRLGLRSELRATPSVSNSRRVIASISCSSRPEGQVVLSMAFPARQGCRPPNDLVDPAAFAFLSRRRVVPQCPKPACGTEPTSKKTVVLDFFDRVREGRSRRSSS